MTCLVCGGSGGWDTSNNCEDYDDWQNCSECGGTGEIDDEES